MIGISIEWKIPDFGLEAEPAQNLL